MVLVLRRWSTEGQQLPYIRVDQQMHHQMSNTSIPERWNSTKQLKLLFVCAQRLKDCEMNITRVARGAAVTGLGKNHSEGFEGFVASLKNSQYNFPKMRGSKAVWNFSENSYILEGKGVPNDDRGCMMTFTESTSPASKA